MNAKQSNKLVSYAATEAVLKANPEVVNVPGLAAKVAQLSARIGEINILAGTQTQPTAVSRTNRDQRFEAMAELALVIAGVVSNAARDHALPDVGQAVRIGATSFRHLRRAHRIWLAQRVHDTALTIVDRLETYGVTVDRLGALQAAIQAASEGIHMPRTTVTAKKAATERLASLFREVDALLKDEIDRLVLQLRRVQPEFFADYRAARAVLDRRGRRAAVAVEAGPAAAAAAPASSGTGTAVAA